jgi:hypothetical protein
MARRISWIGALQFVHCVVLFVRIIELNFPTDLNAESLRLSSGVIWTALNVDYPGHSFSHLGMFFGM